MEKITRLPIFVITIALLVLGSCIKEKAGSGGKGRYTDSMLEQLKYPDSLKRAAAGNDILVELPASECGLSGAVDHMNLDGAVFSWTKISGPDSCTLDNPNYGFTVVRNLQKGVYQFEFKITDKTGYSARDTLRVIVGQLPETPQELIFTNLTWISPWDNEVEIPDFYTSLAPGTFYKVYIRRGNSTVWIEVKPYPRGGSYDPNQVYDFFTLDWYGSDLYHFGSLYVSYYGSDISDHPDVKILY